MKKKRVILTKRVKLWKRLSRLAWLIPVLISLWTVMNDYEGFRQELRVIFADSAVAGVVFLVLIGCVIMIVAAPLMVIWWAATQTVKKAVMRNTTFNVLQDLDYFRDRFLLDAIANRNVNMGTISEWKNMAKAEVVREGYLKDTHNDQKAQVDVQLKRRYDLIPNLVETAKAYAGFEKSTLEAVTQARTHAMQAGSMGEELTANAELTRALQRFIVVSENYPELKANANFIQLQNELSATEDKIAKARQFYNDTVLKYNNAVEMIPANIVAGVFGHKKLPFLEAAQSEREAVKISADQFRM